MGKRIFNTYHASEAETNGVKAALDASGIAYYETHKGKWGVGSSALWVADADDYPQARAAIDSFQQEWREKVRQEPMPTDINWARLPVLLMVIGVVLYLTFFWYF